MQLDEVAIDAMKLDHRDRAELAQRLLLSLEEGTPAEIERLWLEESERRLREYREGQVEAIPAEEVFRRVIAEISA